MPVITRNQAKNNLITKNNTNCRIYKMIQRDTIISHETTSLSTQSQVNYFYNQVKFLSDECNETTEPKLKVITSIKMYKLINDNLPEVSEQIAKVPLNRFILSIYLKINEFKHDIKTKPSLQLIDRNLIQKLVEELNKAKKYLMPIIINMESHTSYEDLLLKSLKEINN